MRKLLVLKLAIKVSYGKRLTEIIRLITVIYDGVKSDTITCIIHDPTASSLVLRLCILTNDLLFWKVKTFHIVF